MIMRIRSIAGLSLLLTPDHYSETTTASVRPPGCGLTSRVRECSRVALIVTLSATDACEALNGRGERCCGTAGYTIDLGAAGRRRLCGQHWQMAQRRAVPLWDRPGKLAGSWRPWTAEEDDVVLVNPAVDVDELARQLGRTIWAVKSRRARLQRWSIEDE